MVIVGLSGTTDSIERLDDAFVDVEQLFDEIYSERNRYIFDNYQETHSQVRETGRAVISVVEQSTYLSLDDLDNIEIGHASLTREMLKRCGD